MLCKTYTKTLVANFPAPIRAFRPLLVFLAVPLYVFGRSSCRSRMGVLPKFLHALWYWVFLLSSVSEKV
ncbi:hypothetical protein FKM82_004454 [Ascaphus truei]